MDNNFDLLEIHTDGGARGNPGPAAIGVYATASDQVIFTLSKKIGNTTNNVAEYTAVLQALEFLKNQDIYSQKIKFVLDSELIVKQITGLYKVKQPHLQDLRSQVVSLINHLRQDGHVQLLSFSHVLRNQNKEADRLVNQALDS